MTVRVNLIDALDDLRQTAHLLDLLALATSGMSGKAKCSDAAAISAGLEIAAANVSIAMCRLRELSGKIEADRRPPRMIIARIARRLGLNLNWIFCPVTAWRRGEPARLR